VVCGWGFAGSIPGMVSPGSSLGVPANRRKEVNQSRGGYTSQSRFSWDGVSSFERTSPPISDEATVAPSEGKAAQQRSTVSKMVGGLGVGPPPPPPPRPRADTVPQ